MCTYNPTKNWTKGVTKRLQQSRYVWNGALHGIRQKSLYRRYPYPTSSVFDTRLSVFASKTYVFVFISEVIRIQIRIRIKIRKQIWFW
jgi:hypothetical protein